MEKNELVLVLGNAKPLFSDLGEMCSQLERMDQEIAAKKRQMKNGLSGIQIVVTIFAGCYLIVPGVIYFFWAKNSNKKQNQKLEDEIALLEGMKSDQEERINKQVEIIKETGIQQVLPAEYLDPVSVSYIYSYLSGGRADDLKEAMNLFEEEKHRMNMENMQNEYLKQMQLGNKIAAYGNLINAANAINLARIANR